MVNFENKKKEIIHYQKFGWTKFEKIFDKKEIKKLKSEINSFLKKNHKKYQGRHINYFGKSNSFKDISSFHSLQSNEKIKKISDYGIIPNIAKKLLKKKPELRASELFIKKKGFGNPTPVHQDAYYWNVKNNEGLTIWIALTSSKKKNGSVFYFNKSHKKGIFAHKSSFIKGSSQTIKNLKKLKQFSKVSPEANIGDIIVHNSLVVHGSFKNLSNQKRIGLTFCYKPKTVPYDLKRTKKFEKKLFYQIKQREK